MVGVVGAAVTEADEEPEEAMPHFSDSSPIGFTLAAFATHFFPVGTPLNLTSGYSKTTSASSRDELKRAAGSGRTRMQEMKIVVNTL